MWLFHVCVLFDCMLVLGPAVGIGKENPQVVGRLPVATISGIGFHVGGGGSCPHACSAHLFMCTWYCVLPHNHSTPLSGASCMHNLSIASSEAWSGTVNSCSIFRNGSRRNVFTSSRKETSFRLLGVKLCFYT